MPLAHFGSHNEAEELFAEYRKESEPSSLWGNRTREKNLKTPQRKIVVRRVKAQLSLRKMIKILAKYNSFPEFDKDTKGSGSDSFDSDFTLGNSQKKTHQRDRSDANETQS